MKITPSLPASPSPARPVVSRPVPTAPTAPSSSEEPVDLVDLGRYRVDVFNRGGFLMAAVLGAAALLSPASFAGAPLGFGLALACSAELGTIYAGSLFGRALVAGDDSPKGRLLNALAPLVGGCAGVGLAILMPAGVREVLSETGLSCGVAAAAAGFGYLAGGWCNSVISSFMSLHAQESFLLPRRPGHRHRQTTEVSLGL